MLPLAVLTLALLVGAGVGATAWVARRLPEPSRPFGPPYGSILLIGCGLAIAATGLLFPLAETVSPGFAGDGYDGRWTNLEEYQVLCGVLAFLLWLIAPFPAIAVGLGLTSYHVVRDPEGPVMLRPEWPVIAAVVWFFSIVAVGWADMLPSA